ncbi:hypothetical protein ECTW00353_0333, partial [Escherichia coli TW00353]
MLSDKVAGGG